MSLAVFTPEGLIYLLRWFHYFFGVLWIGLLYYFNFVQGSFFAETDAATKSNAIQKLVPRALWWFRWAAMFTMVTGVTILGYRGHQGGIEIFMTGWGPAILTGATFGLLMWANVWFIIWPNQKVVIQNATDVAAGKPANPGAAAAGARAGLASRTNVLFSIPMLFFMGAGRHLPIQVDNGNFMGYAIFVAVLLGALELNSIKGKQGVMTTVRGVITSGFVLAVVVYLALEIMI
jgi:uncharacterized membrane protein